MKLYIPTCTLNFNNIFATESISPNSFYQRRGFGNKRFYSVAPNNRENEILLYSKCPLFETEHSDVENFPLVIEIETEDYADSFFEKVKEMDGVEVYVCPKTVYLNPFHCLVYFRSYSELQATLSKAEQSLENKFYKLYRNNCAVKTIEKKSWIKRTFFDNKESTTFEWKPLISEVSIESSAGSTNYDLLIDKIKGFLYCYLIGANNGTSPDVAKLKSIARKLRNTVSAVVNSPDRRPTEFQDETILKLVKEFNHIYSQTDEDCSYNSKLLYDSLSSNPLNLGVEECTTLLKHFGVYESYKSKLQLRRVYDASDVWTCIEYGTPETFNRVFETMNNAIRRIELRFSAQNPKLHINELVNVSSDLAVSITDKSYKTDFYESLINSQLKAEYQNIMRENDVEEPLAQAFNGGLILKSLMGDVWEKSPVSLYIKSLLNHFQENTAFDLFACDNDVISSFAAFCQKGDNIDRLSEYLVSCGFCNYKLAYGIYGATRGLASLPKTFTTALINGDKEYCKTVCVEMYHLLYGITLCNTDFPSPQTGTFELSSNPIGSKILEHMETVESNPKKRDSVVAAISQAVELEDAVQSPRAFMYIADNILARTKMFKALKDSGFENDKTAYTEETFKKKVFSIIEPALPTSKQARKEAIDKINKILELEAKRQDPDAFLFILDNFIDRKSKAYKEITKIFVGKETDKDYADTGIQRVEKTSYAVGPKRIPFSIQNIDVIASLISILNPKLSDFANKQIHKDLQWVFDPKYSKGKHELDLLETFRSILISGKNEPYSKNGKDMRWKNDAYRELDIEKTISALKERIN